MNDRRKIQPGQRLGANFALEMVGRVDRLSQLMGVTRSDFLRVAVGEAVMRLEGGCKLPDYGCKHPVEIKDSGGRYCGICGKGIPT